MPRAFPLEFRRDVVAVAVAARAAPISQMGKAKVSTEVRAVQFSARSVWGLPGPASLRN